jgi:hypothetical protein
MIIDYLVAYFIYSTFLLYNFLPLFKSKILLIQLMILLPLNYLNSSIVPHSLAWCYIV